jgi:hypothetical protein
MMDPTLVVQVEALSSTRGMKLLSPESTRDVVERMAAKFSVDRSRLWWWEGIQSARSFPYAPDEELQALGRLMSSHSNALTLIVTDDQPPPWIAVSGPWTSLLHLLQETRHFEFFVLDETLNWVVFDTHHNELVVAGTPVPE